MEEEAGLEACPLGEEVECPVGVEYPEVIQSREHRRKVRTSKLPDQIIRVTSRPAWTWAEEEVEEVELRGKVTST